MSAKSESVKSSKQNEAIIPEKEKGISIQYPFLILSILVFILYAGSLSFGFTELDDTIFIKETKAYNEAAGSLIHSFSRGVFSETNDTYYRPLLLDSFIINNMMSDTEVKGYHAMNLLFHLISVLLLFVVFKRLGLDELKSFLLTCLFAIHPVLSQAVAWIPGRNDTLLAVFVFSFMIFALNYIRDGKMKWLVLQFVFLLAAFFTKETAVFIAPAFFILSWMMLNYDWKSKQQLLLYATWIGTTILWFVIRSMATIKNDPLNIGSMITHLPVRMSLAIQYLGKIILPFNLSVFPMLNQTTYLFGLIAIVLLAVGIYFSKNRNIKVVIGGLLWFMILLAPLFILPSSLNDQDFEHRLYLPIIGILILLSETALFKNLNQRILMYSVVGICIVFGGINYAHQQNFKDPIAFWTQAVETSPKSSYANMMLAARTKQIDAIKAEEMMWNAYRLNPKEKYVNYYLGQLFLDKNQVDSADKYLSAELKTSAYFETPFLLSRVAFMKQDTMKSIRYMEDYLKVDSTNSQGINNYVLMLTQTNQWEKAKNFIAQKQAQQIVIPKALVDLVNQPHP